MAHNDEFAWRKFCKVSTLRGGGYMWQVVRHVPCKVRYLLYKGHDNRGLFSFFFEKKKSRRRGLFIFLFLVPLQDVPSGPWSPLGQTCAASHGGPQTARPRTLLPHRQNILSWQYPPGSKKKNSKVSSAGGFAVCSEHTGCSEQTRCGKETRALGFFRGSRTDFWVEWTYFFLFNVFVRESARERAKERTCCSEHISNTLGTHSNTLATH